MKSAVWLWHSFQREGSSKKLCSSSTLLPAPRATVVGVSTPRVRKRWSHQPGSLKQDAEPLGTGGCHATTLVLGLQYRVRSPEVGFLGL